MPSWAASLMPGHDADLHSAVRERRYDLFLVMFEGRAVESLAPTHAGAQARILAHRRKARRNIRRHDRGDSLSPNSSSATLPGRPDWSDGEFDEESGFQSPARMPSGALSSTLTHELTMR